MSDQGPVLKPLRVGVSTNNTEAESLNTVDGGQQVPARTEEYKQRMRDQDPGLKPLRVDLSAKKTEAEWQDTVDHFWLSFTPKWFEWMGWLFVLGALYFFAKKTGELSLNLLYAVGHIAVYFYFQSFFARLDLHGLPFVKSTRSARMVSLVLAGILSISVYLLLQAAIPKLEP
jgi:hypothetical protein